MHTSPLFERLKRTCNAIEKSAAIEQTARLEAFSTLQETIQSLETWDAEFSGWMSSILWQLKQSYAEIEALTVAANVGGWLTDKEAAELFRLAS